MSDDNVLIKQNDTEMEVGLADIAGIDMNAVEAFEGGFEATPKGVYVWEVKDAGIKPQDSQKGKKATIYFELECQQCLALVDDDRDEESMIGWKHIETIWIGDLAKSVGQAKAICQNAGFEHKGSLEEMLDAFCGHQFVSPIKQRKDKNDTDIVYSNLVIKKITPVPGAEADAEQGAETATPSLVG